MIEKFALSSVLAPSEGLDLNDTSNPLALVSPMIPELARGPRRKLKRTSESGR